MKLFLFFLSIFFTFLSYSQTKYTLSGYITDAKNGEVLVGTKIFIPSINQGTVSNNYGFYSFYVASLSLGNQVLAFEASPKTFNSFKANLDLNNFRNIDYRNLAISEVSGKFISFYESHNDWESSATHNKFKNNKIYTICKIND